MQNYCNRDVINPPLYSAAGTSIAILDSMQAGLTGCTELCEEKIASMERVSSVGREQN